MPSAGRRYLPLSSARFNGGETFGHEENSRYEKFYPDIKIVGKIERTFVTLLLLLHKERVIIIIKCENSTNI